MPIKYTDPEKRPRDQVVTVGTATETDTAFSVTAVNSVYTATAASFTASAQQSAVLALKPKLEALPDMILVAIGHGEEPAGPHLGNPDLPEGTLKPLAANALTERHRRRDNWRWIIGTCIVAPFLVVLGVVLKSLF